MSAYRRLVLGAAGRSLVEKVVTATAPGRRIAGRFVAGETLGDALAVASSLTAAGHAVSLDHLGEEVTDAAAAGAARDEYIACLESLEGAGFGGDDRVNVSVKLTQLGLAIDPDLAVRSLDAVAAAAAAVGTTVTIDMEDSRFTTAILDVYSTVQEARGNLGVALQAALRRTPADLERIRPLGGHVRLCKGAYLESPEVAFADRKDVVAAFAGLLADVMTVDTPMPAVATHDETLLAVTAALATRRRAPFEVQMLYGVRRDLQRRLLADGLPVRVYVPYGSAWYPYLTRRLAEKPSNLALLAGALPRPDGSVGGVRRRDDGTM